MTPFCAYIYSRSPHHTVLSSKMGKRTTESLHGSVYFSMVSIRCGPRAIFSSNGTHPVGRQAGISIGGLCPMILGLSKHMDSRGNERKAEGKIWNRSIKWPGLYFDFLPLQLFRIFNEGRTLVVSGQRNPFVSVVPGILEKSSDVTSVENLLRTSSSKHTFVVSKIQRFPQLCTSVLIFEIGIFRKNKESTRNFNRLKRDENCIYKIKPNI